MRRTLRWFHAEPLWTRAFLAVYGSLFLIGTPLWIRSTIVPIAEFLARSPLFVR